MKRPKWLLFFLFFIILTGCVSNEGKDFIESKKTQAEVNELVEETFSQALVPIEVSADDAIYKPDGKGKDEEIIRVNYQTINIPTFHGMAFVNVDVESEPRKLLDVAETRIIHPYEYDLYDLLMHYTFLQANQTAIQEMKDVGDRISGISYTEDEHEAEEGLSPYVEMKLNRDQLTSDKQKALFSDYKTNKFATANEQEAQELLDSYLFLDIDQEARIYPSEERELLPRVIIHYEYDGSFNNHKMNDLLSDLLDIKDLPDAFYTIDVKAADYEQVESSEVYNKDHSGETHHQFVGYLRVDGDLKDKSSSQNFTNEDDEA